MRIFAVIGAVVLLLLIACSIYFYVNWEKHYIYLPNKPDTFYKLSDGIMINSSTNKPFSGRMLTDFDELKEIYTYKDGKLNGLNVIYFNNNIKEIGHWKDGKQDGLFQTYTEEGVLTENAYFKDNQRHGLTKQYHPETGEIRIEANYTNGMFDGVVKEHYSNGKTFIEINYTNGVKNGITKEYYPTGAVRVKLNYIDDEPEGAYIIFNENGEVQLEGKFENGEFVAKDNESTTTNSDSKK